jgi:hypothetical protein
VAELTWNTLRPLLIEHGIIEAGPIVFNDDLVQHAAARVRDSPTFPYSAEDTERVMRAMLDWAQRRPPPDS